MTFQIGTPYHKEHNQILSNYVNNYDNTAKHFLLWSGGCDSTLMLYELLDAYGAENVVAVSYKYSWLDTLKINAENEFREKFKTKVSKLSKRYQNFTHMEITVDSKNISGNYINLTGSCCGLPQAVAWLFSIPLWIESNSYLYQGCVKGDDLSYNLDAYQNIFHNMCKVLNKKITLRQPYIYLNKSEIIEKLFEYDIYDQTWFCELPLDRKHPCCKCTPCKTHLAALYLLKVTSQSKKIRQFVDIKIKQMIKIGGDSNEA